MYRRQPSKAKHNQIKPKAKHPLKNKLNKSC